MKPVLIITPYRELIGGVEIVTESLAAGLAQNGFKIDWLTSESLKAQSLWDKILLKIIGLPYLTAKAYKKIDPKKYSHIICNGEYALGIHHEKSIVYFHGSYYGLRKFNFGQLSLKNKLTLSWRSYLQTRAAKNKKVIAVSDFLKVILSEQKIKVDEVISNPIDLQKFYPKHLKKNDDYIFVGRYDYWSKGIDIIEELALKNYPIACFMSGKAVNTKIDLRAPVSHNELNDIYNQHKALLFPSRFESFGMVPAEAMASGLPVFMHAVGLGFELKKMIPDFIISNFNDEQELKEKTQKIKDNYEHYSNLSRKYAEEHFSSERFIKKWLKVLHA